MKTKLKYKKRKQKKLIIELTNVNKVFSVSSNHNSKNKTEDFYALKNINLKVFKGDKLGLIGPNGAGKTTLCKIIAGISTPSSGTVKIQGKIVAITDLQAGFHPDLTGYENITLNGLIIGMSKSEIESKKQQIIQFADINRYINEPFYTYSSGMKFRLAFAIAIASKCDILILDEVFISGDIDFQQKTLAILKKIQSTNKITTIICSHLPSLIWSFSNIFYQINNGLIKKLHQRQAFIETKKQHQKWVKNFALKSIVSS